MPGVLHEGHAKITDNQQQWFKVLKRVITCYKVCSLVISLSFLGLAGCYSDQPASNLTIPSASTPLQLPPPTAVATSTTPPASSDHTTVAIAVTLAAPTLLPTSTISAPTATITPTLSLLAALSQTVNVTSVSVLSTTVLITHAAPPVVVAPVLGPEPTNTVVSASLTITPLTTLQPDGIGRTARVPILMYHYLSTPPENADIYRRDLSVPPDLFIAHLDRMKAEGYTTISLYDLVAHLQQGTPLPAKPVILTFDDGYRDNYENAYPLLRERQMTATFFVVMEFINQERPGYLTWDMVRAMDAGGMSIEAHGVDHTTLRKRSRVGLEFQALRSYETLQDRLGVRPRFLSYPAGEYDADTIAVLEAAGYWAAVTTVQGATHSSDHRFELHRVRIRNTTTPDELMRLLSLDW